MSEHIKEQVRFGVRKNPRYIVIKELEEVEFVSLTTDGGTSSNAVSFLDINAHYIDKNFEMKSVVLAVRENKESHTAENYRKKTDEVVEEFGLNERPRT